MIELAICAAVLVALFGSRFVDVDEATDAMGGLRSRAVDAVDLEEDEPEEVAA